MKINLQKVSKSPFNFEKKVDNLTFKGFLKYEGDKLFLFEAKLQGTIDTTCDLCGEEYAMDVNEDLKFYISDGIFKDDEHSNIDVVEAFESELCLDDILTSEIELIKNDYHCCEDCEYSDD